MDVVNWRASKANETLLYKYVLYTYVCVYVCMEVHTYVCLP